MKNVFKILILLILSAQVLFSVQIKLTEEEKKYLEKNMPIVVHGHNSFPPFNYAQNGKSKGYTHDYINLVSKYTGIEFKFTRPTPWGETIKLFKDGEIDILPHVARNKARESFIDYTNFNHLEYLIGVTVRKNDLIKSMDDLEDKVIAVVNKSFIHTYLKKNSLNQKLLSAPATSDAISLVSSGKADAFIGSIPMMDFYIKKSWYNNLEAKTIEGIGLENKVFMPMGVHKGNTILKGILEKANLEIPYNELVKLKEKWLNINNKKEKELILTQDEKVYLDKKENIKICVLPNALPFGTIDKNGKHLGIGAEIFELISKQIDEKFVLVPTKKWSESIQNLKNRTCDILPVAMEVPSRKDSMNFTKPYLIEPIVIATRSDKIFINESSELSGKKIGMPKDFAFVELLKEKNPDIEFVYVDNVKQGLEKVRKREIYGFVDIMSAIAYNIQENSMLDIKVSGKLEFDIKLRIASRNDEPLLNEILQKSLDIIGKEKIKQIVGNWYSIKVEEAVDYSLLINICIVFIVIILIVLYKNRQVKLLNEKLIEKSTEVIDQQNMVDKHVMILTTDIDAKIIDANTAYCEKLAYTKDELLGRTPYSLHHPDMSKELSEDLNKTVSDGKIWRGEIKNITKENKAIYFQTVIEPYIKNGKKVGYRSISEDITDKKRIEELSITDKLTRLYNRMKLDELLNEQVNLYERYEVPFSIILIDIDNFKRINDTYGHDVGDNVLVEIASLLRMNIRSTDFAGRWGGEEFLIICQSTPIEDAYVLAEKIRNKIQDTKFDKVENQTISLGVTQYNKKENLLSVFRAVDKALYHAKNNGKNQTIKSIDL